jgi:hypothetical protein
MKHQSRKTPISRMPALGTFAGFLRAAWRVTALLITPLLVASPISLKAGERTKEARTRSDAKWVNDLSSIAKSDWNYDRAAHLFERAGFGGTPDEIKQLAAMTPQEAVNHFVDYVKIDNSHLPSFDESGILDPGMLPLLSGLSEAITLAYRTTRAQGIQVKVEGPLRLQPVVDQTYYQMFADRLETGRIGQWWAERMMNTRRPLEEKMTLFWHGHFATSNDKVRDYRKMLLQLDLLRKNATGSFRDLLLGVAQDPAMLVYLDNRLNVKGSANENFAREVMELFSLGVGNYTEKDIREAARAFTGWTNTELSFVVNAKLHDRGSKTFLGNTGDFNGEDVIRIILQQDATSHFIVRKLYRFVVRDDLSPELEAKLADEFRSSNYELKPLLRTIFLSKDFYSPASCATQIKSPVHLMVSTYRKLGLGSVPGIPDFRTMIMSLGQELGFPPNVKGWDGGRTWINPATLIQRGNFAQELLFPNPASFMAPDRVMPETLRQSLRQALNEVETGDGNTAPGSKPVMANMEADAAASRSNNFQISRTPDYNLAIGIRNGYQKALDRIRPIPRSTAVIDLVSMLKTERKKTADAAVDYFVRLLLRVPVHEKDRTALISFLKREVGGDKIKHDRPALEESLRRLVHLIMSMPEYQLD